MTPPLSYSVIYSDRFSSWLIFHNDCVKILTKQIYQKNFYEIIHLWFQHYAGFNLSILSLFLRLLMPVQGMN